jgi:hypothetical protein
MANCGNFLDYAGQQCGIDVGYGKMFLVYGSKVAKAASDLTATAINAEIAAGTIIGVIKGWHTIAGAPVAEISVERTGTAEMKLIRAEIAADTLTFENNIANNEILGDVVKAGSLNCILIDDQGNAFGDYAPEAGNISSMLVNFSNKVSSSFQKDNVTEKTVAVTARYLVGEVCALEAGTETELVDSKSLLRIQLSSVTSIGATSIVLVASVKDKSTGKPYTGAIASGEVVVAGVGVTSATGVYAAATGLLTITVTGTGFIQQGQILDVSVSGDIFYSKVTPLNILLGE